MSILQYTFHKPEDKLKKKWKSVSKRSGTGLLMLKISLLCVSSRNFSDRTYFLLYLDVLSFTLYMCSIVLSEALCRFLKLFLFLHVSFLKILLCDFQLPQAFSSFFSISLTSWAIKIQFWFPTLREVQLTLFVSLLFGFAVMHCLLPNL